MKLSFLYVRLLSLENRRCWCWLKQGSIWQGMSDWMFRSTSREKENVDVIWFKIRDLETRLSAVLVASWTTRRGTTPPSRRNCWQLCGESRSSALTCMDESSFCRVITCRFNTWTRWRTPTADWWDGLCNFSPMLLCSRLFQERRMWELIFWADCK